MPATPISEKDVAELRELLAKATPGPWAEDDLWNNDSGTRYRDSQIIASNPLHPSHMDRTITICDTLNAWYCFSEEDREANMKLICALYNAAHALLALASQSQERDAEIRRAAFKEFDALVCNYPLSHISLLHSNQAVAANVCCNILEQLRALAQQPTDVEVKT